MIALVGCNQDDDSQSPIYLDENGITVKCQDWAEVGQRGKLNGIIYTVVDGHILRQMVENREDVTTVCTTRITDMADMFYLKYRGFFDQDISSWDVSNVTDMHGMFQESKFFNQDIGSWDVANVTDMAHMFSGAYLFNQDISSWDVSKVSDMRYMFKYCYFNQDISSWDVSSVMNMSSMFFDTPFNQDISSWNVSNVTDMAHMFRSAVRFNQDLSTWDVDNVNDCTFFSRATLVWTEPKPSFTNCTPN